MNGPEPTTAPGDRDASRPAPEGRSRPRVVCHMMSSLDGRIVTDDWPLSADARRQYEQVHATYDADGWLAALRGRGASCLLASRSDVDLALALEKIGARFGVRTLMLEGGGGINGSMLRAGPVDEISLLVAPARPPRLTSRDRRARSRGGARAAAHRFRPHRAFARLPARDRRGI